MLRALFELTPSGSQKCPENSYLGRLNQRFVVMSSTAKYVPLLAMEIMQLALRAAIGLGSLQNVTSVE
jgi:hypothetical protein